MFLRTIRSAFILSGLVLLLSAFTDARSAIRANILSGQGSLVIRESTEQWHAAASQEAQRTTAGQIALGALFLFLGFGLHAAMVRRQSAGRPVKVHKTLEHKHEKSPQRHWVLWMNVKM